MKIKLIMNKKLIPIFILIISFFLIYGLVYAQLENEYPEIPGVSSPTDTASFLEYIYEFLVITGIIIAVIIIIWQGITMIISRGEMAIFLAAKQKLVSVVIGVAILLCSYILLTTINPNLTFIKIDVLPEMVFNNVNNSQNKKTLPTEYFQEIPLGTIVESILAGNSSRKIEEYKDETEELCFAYDENGNTIDRNKDGFINEKDLLKGVDIYYCLTELNKALIKKIEDVNGGNYRCNSQGNNGPIEEMKGYIVSGCSCGSCYEYPVRIDPYGCSVCVEGCCRSPRTPFACRSGCDSCSSCCDSRCQCCGRMYYFPDTGCQKDYVSGGGDVEHDPCGETRDGIDCTRNEIKVRINGTYDWAPSNENCAFLNYFIENYEEGDGKLPNGYQFLTITTAKDRLKSFESYFKNHLEDLKKAEAMMKNIYAEKISLAEFQNLQMSDRGGVVTEAKIFENTNKDYFYDIIKYCREFNCTQYKNNKETNLCVGGERDALTPYLYEKEELYDENYDTPSLQNRRVCKVEDDKNKIAENKEIEKYYYDGDGATFYYKENFSYEDLYPVEKINLDTNIEKESIKSLIPIGEVVDDTEKFAEDMIVLISSMLLETEKTITKGLELSELPEKCDCTLGCSNSPNCNISCDEEGCCSASCSSCSSCNAKSQQVCSCCDECEIITVIDDSKQIKTLNQAWNDPKNPCKSPIYEEGGKYWTYCPCPGTGLLKARQLVNGKWVDVFLMPPAITDYKITSCNTVLLSPPIMGSNFIGNTKNKETEYSYKTYLTIEPNYPTKIINTCEGEIDQGLLDRMNWWCIGAEGSSEEDMNNARLSWLDEDTFETINEATAKGSGYSYTCRHIKDSKGNILCSNPNSVASAFPIDFSLPAGYTAICEEKPIENVLSIGGIYARYYFINLNENPNYCEGERYCYLNAKTRIDRKLVVTLKNVIPLPKRGESDNKDYYVCPWNDILDRQCRIYKYSEDVDPNYPENINTDYDCKNEKSSGAGYLQKIVLLNNRIENLINAKDLRQADVNRWRTLEMLSLSRQRMEECVIGYNFSYKSNLSTTVLYSCEEGIDAGILNKFVILPQFPYPVSLTSWNCYPFNSSKLTSEQRKSCFSNKNLENSCQTFIKDYMNNYYCSQGKNY
jgi:hypothetical protein